MERQGNLQRTLRQLGAVLARPFIDVLKVAEVTPTQVTVMGVAFAFAGGVALSCGAFRTALALFIIAAACDWLDGALAKATGTATKVGEFVDRVSDRVSDTAMFGSAVAFYAREWSAFGLITSGVALIASVVIPYVKALAESHDIPLEGGIMTRAPRTILFLVGVALGPTYMVYPMSFIAIGGTLTAFQRTFAVISALRSKESPAPQSGGNP